MFVLLVEIYLDPSVEAMLGLLCKGILWIINKWKSKFAKHVCTSMHVMMMLQDKVGTILDHLLIKYMHTYIVFVTHFASINYHV